ncbi:MAG: TIGR02300 family protein [Pseudomonadota bacterium]
MPNPDWGVKRTCPNCATRFYDLMRKPITCPECGTVIDLTKPSKGSPLSAATAAAAAKATSAWCAWGCLPAGLIHLPKEDKRLKTR